MANYARVTLTQIQGFLAERVGNNTVFWPAAQTKEAINHAIRVWQALTGEWTETVNIALSGTSIIPLTTGYAPFRVLWNGVALTPTSIEELDYGFPDWQDATGTPLMWAPVGATQVALYPRPTANSGQALCLKQSITLSAGGDFIQIGDEDLQKLLAYAHHYLTWKEGSSEMEATKGALMGLIEAAVRKNSQLRTTNFYRSYMGGRGKKVLAPVEVLGVRSGA